MPDLDLRFDDLTEKYYDRMLAQIREFAQQTPLPEALTIEIGSNRGKFIEGLAKRHPERFFLGIELRAKFARQANDRYRRHKLDNALVLRADANLAIPIIFDDGQLTELFALYPDPWWKKRHRKRRIIRPDSLDLLARKIRPGGKLWLRTDVGPLANDMRATLNAHPEFELTPLEEYPLDPFPFSERDTRSIGMGMPVQLLYYTRR